MKQIFIIDNYPLTRRGISLILEEEPDYRVCGHAEDAETALEALKTLDPDLTVVELAVPGMLGLDLIKRMRANKPGMRILILSRYDELKYAALSLKAGASGYVMKKATIEAFRVAVHRVLDGEVYVSEAVNKQLLDRLTTQEHKETPLPSEVLSNREWEIFELIGHGMSPRDMAKHLNLSRKTVDTHRSRIKRKLQLDSYSDMMRMAMWWIEHENA